MLWVNVSLDPPMASRRSHAGANIRMIVIPTRAIIRRIRKALPLSRPRRCNAVIPGSNRYTTNIAATKGTMRTRTAMNARTRAASSRTNARTRRGTSPNRFFMGPSDYRHVGQLGVGVAQALGQSLCKTKADFCAHRRVQRDDLDQVRMKEADKLRSLAGYGRCRP